MIVKGVIKFYTHNLRGSRYVWMCVCSVSYMVLSSIGGELQSLLLT